MSLRVLLLCPPPSLDGPRVAPRHSPAFTIIAAAALRAAGHAPIVRDEHLEVPNLARLAAEVTAADPDLVLLMTSDDNRAPAQDVLDGIARLLVRVLPDVPLLGLGRLNEATTARLLAAAPALPGAIFGEPEFGAVAVADALARDRDADWSAAEGVMVRGVDGPMVATPPREDLAGSPTPAWDLLREGSYPFSPHQQTAAPVFTVFASRGCPFRCSYCETGRQPRWTIRPPEEVLAELRGLRGRYGVESVFFGDADFVVDRRKTTALIELLRRERPPGLTWSCMARTDAVDDELLGAMADAGCWNVLFGVESFEPSALRASRKNLDPATVEPAVRAARAAGIEVIASAMIGLPGDSPAGVRRTVEGLVALEPDYAQFFITRLADAEAPEGGRFLSSREGGKRDFDGRVFAPASFAGLDELRDLQRWAYRRFYLRPRYVARRLTAFARRDDPAAELSRLARGARLAAGMSTPWGSWAIRG